MEMKIPAVDRARNNFRNIIGVLQSGISTKYNYLNMIVLSNNF